MKRILLITALFLFSTTSVFALNNIYIDVLGAYVNTKDATKQIGGGYSLGYNIIDNVNIIHRFTYSAGSTSTFVPGDGNTYTDNYEYMFVSVGADYTWFFWNRFGVRAGTLFGFSPLKIKTGYLGPNDEVDTNGFGLVVFAGFHATISQNIAFFVDIGFQYTYFTKRVVVDSIDSYGDGIGNSYSSKPSVLGETIYMGLRFTIGKNNRMSDGY